MNRIPGTLIFNLQGTLLYYNREAMIYLPRLKEHLKNPKIPPQLPEEILSLFEKTKNNLDHETPKESGGIERAFMANKDGQLILRSFPIGDPTRGKSEHFIFLLIEPASSENLMDLPQAAKVFHLSHREIEVIQLICRGLANKEIGELLFISDQTVKDHVKHLMRKMKVNSRTQIMATLLNLPSNQRPNNQLLEKVAKD
jgi:DNA-binding CsgD family transcriptional regulator